MSLVAGYASNVPLRATLKVLVFLFSSFVAVVAASTAFGLLTMLLRGLSNGANIAVGEFLTHSGLTLAFFVVAGLGAYVAKKCFW